MAELLAHFHGGPLAGDYRIEDDRDGSLYGLDVWVNGRRGRYIRDETSAGGRCFDWQGWA